MSNRRMLNRRTSWIHRIHQMGASTAEMVASYFMVTFLAMGVLQTALVYNANLHVNHATLEAARSGAVNHGLREKMQEAFARNMGGMYGGGSDSASISHSLSLAAQDMAAPAAENGAGLKIEILNPTV